MTSMSSASPGLARADRGRPSRVDALTGGACVADDTVRATLREALALLPASGRLRLLESVRADATAAGEDPGPWLAEALAHETHPAVLRAILERLDRTPPGTRAWTTLHEGTQRFLFARPTAPGRHAWFEVCCTDSGLTLHSGVTDHSSLEHRATGLVSCHPRRLAARVAPLLFEHRRDGGSVPDEARAFARLF